MPRSATTPRLAELEPEAVAREVWEKTTHQTVKLATLLGVVNPTVRQPKDCVIGVAAMRLTTWAQTGEGMRPGEVDAAIHMIRDALFSSAADEGRELTPELDAELGDPTNAISCVLLAALARRVVSEAGRGKLVRARWLAALASVAESRVHQLAAEGRLRRVSSGIQTVDAKNWLQERAVPGF